MRRLLLVDPGGRVVLGDLDDGGRTGIAGDPRAGRPTSRTLGRTAVWSPAGRWVAAAVGSEDPDGPQEVRIHHVDAGSDRVLASSLRAFYLNPSPCGRFLSHLSPGPLGLELGVSDVETGELRVLERGQPLFWSWSADSTRLAVHVADRVLVVPVDGGAPQLLTAEAGSFVVPWWTPDGSVVVAAGGQIVSHDPDGAVTRLALDGGAGRFSLDPDGRRLAMVEPAEHGTRLLVLDLLTGEREVVADERTAAFFWSPEGRRLAALVLGGPSHLQWAVSDGETVVRLPPFRPGSGWLREILPFFEQYAQSHAVWSPDGSRLVAPALDADGSTEALVHAVDPAAGTERMPGAGLAWWAHA